MNRNDATTAAVSASWEDRASAARLLAENLDESDDLTRDLVDQLLADRDLAVAQAMAGSLLMRADALAVALFTRAYVGADDQLGDSFNDVLRVAVHDNPALLPMLDGLSRSGDRGAKDALAWLAGH